MNLGKFLTPEVITCDLKGDDKAQIIDSLIKLLSDAGKISEPESIRNCVMERESKMSTGMEAGIAIPHGKTDAVKDLIGCVGIKKSGIDFNSLDGKPSNIFIMTISPLSRTGPHVQFLAEISKVLREEKQRGRLLEASSPEEVLSIICGE